MSTLEQLAAGGVIVLTADTCRELDAMIEQSIDRAVRRGIEIGIQLTKPHPELLSYGDIRQMFGITDNTIRAWASAGVWEIVYKGSRRYIPYAQAIEEKRRQDSRTIV
jgi:hypothetical protein